MDRYIFAESWICILCLMTGARVRCRKVEYVESLPALTTSDDRWGRGEYVPSKGFINASLAMVAQAPLVAAASG